MPFGIISHWLSVNLDYNFKKSNDDRRSETQDTLLTWHESSFIEGILRLKCSHCRRLGTLV